MRAEVTVIKMLNTSAEDELCSQGMHGQTKHGSLKVDLPKPVMKVTIMIQHALKSLVGMAVTTTSSNRKRSYLLFRMILSLPVILSSVAGKTVEVPLVGHITEHGRLYYAQVSFGTKWQSIDLMVDTGSTDTWVYGHKSCDPVHEVDARQCCEYRSLLGSIL